MPLAIGGLGNPGSEYADTRHNLGFMVIEELLGRFKLKLKKKGRAGLARAKIGDEIFFFIPLTFMNLSGQAVKQILRENNLSPRDLLIICDDYNLPFGKLRFRPGGSSGGHNGLLSIVEQLGTQEFARLRIGLGEPPSGEAVDYVLGEFSPAEKKELPQIISRAADQVLEFIKSRQEE